MSVLDGLTERDAFDMPFETADARFGPPARSDPSLYSAVSGPPEIRALPLSQFLAYAIYSDPTGDRMALSPDNPPTPLAVARFTQGMTQEHLAERAGVSRASVRRMEAGGRRPSIDTALKVAAVLGESVGGLFPLDRDEKCIPA